MSASLRRLVGQRHGKTNFRSSASSLRVGVGQEPVASTSKMVMQMPAYPSCQACVMQRRMISTSSSVNGLLTDDVVQENPNWTSSNRSVDGRISSRRPRSNKTYAAKWKSIAPPGLSFGPPTLEFNGETPLESFTALWWSDLSQDLRSLLSDFQREVQMGKGYHDRAISLLDEIDIRVSDEVVVIPRIYVTMLITSLGDAYAQHPSKDAAPVGQRLPTLLELGEELSSKIDKITAFLNNGKGGLTEPERIKILNTYLTLGYVPGAIRVWSDWKIPRSKWAATVLATISKYIRLHRQIEGEEVAQRLAEDLVPPAVAVFNSVHHRSPFAASWLLGIAAKANNLELFNEITRTYYRFNYQFPGVPLDPSTNPQNERQRVFPMTPRVVNHVLEILSKRHNLSSMITVYEHFHSTENRRSGFPHLDNPLFDYRLPANEIMRYLSQLKLIQASNKVGAYHMARHYTRLLFSEWEKSTKNWMWDVRASLPAGIPRNNDQKSREQSILNRKPFSKAKHGQQYGRFPPVVALAERIPFIPPDFVSQIVKSIKAYQQLPLPSLRTVSDQMMHASRIMENQTRQLNQLQSQLQDFPEPFAQDSASGQLQLELSQISSIVSANQETYKLIMKKFYEPTKKVVKARKVHSRAKYKLNLTLKGLGGGDTDDNIHEYLAKEWEVCRARLRLVAAKIRKFLALENRAQAQQKRLDVALKAAVAKMDEQRLKRGEHVLENGNKYV